jgi:hypothetical protein
MLTFVASIVLFAAIIPCTSTRTPAVTALSVTGVALDEKVVLGLIATVKVQPSPLLSVNDVGLTALTSPSTFTKAIVIWVAVFGAVGLT